MRRPIPTATRSTARMLLAALAALAASVHAEPPYWRGELVYFADSALFTDCASGKRWPVAMVGDFPSMQRSYMQWQSAPAAPLLLSFEGRLEVREAMEGPPREQMVVQRFSSVEPGNSCALIATRKSGAGS